MLMTCHVSLHDLRTGPKTQLPVRGEMEVSLNEVMPPMVRIQVAPGRDLAQGHQVRGSRTGVCTLVRAYGHMHM